MKCTDCVRSMRLLGIDFQFCVHSKPTNHSSLTSSAPSAPSALAAFFLPFLLARRFLARSAFNSSSSSSFSVFTSSGLYQIGGWVMSVGPPGRSAMVKWNAATKVLAGVNLCSNKSDSGLENYAPDCYAHHLVRLDQAVLDGFLETHAGALLVVQSADVEGECSGLLLYLREHGAGVLGLQLVCHRGISLEDGGARFLETSLE